MTLFTLRTLGLHDLGPTVSRFRELLAKFRNRKVLKGRLAVGAIEPKVTADGTHFLVHCHLVIDLAATDLEALQRDLGTSWRQLTNGLGMFGIHPNPEVKSIPACAAYITKVADVSPPPGRLDLGALDALRQGMAGRQLLVEWSTGRRGQRKRVDLPASEALF